MNHINSSPSADEKRKFPVTSLLVAVAIIAAAAAILVFNVPVGTVLTYGFLGVMVFSHFFMHGGHGAHGGHGQDASPSEQNGEHVHANPDSAQTSEHNHADGPAQPGNSETKSDKKDPNSHQGHSGHC